MIYIQPLRRNDVNPSMGKQFEFGKAFFTDYNWKGGETHPLTIHYGKDTTIHTSIKVRGDERGGERVGADGKEYAIDGKLPLKDLLINRLKLNENHVGIVTLIFEPINMSGTEYNLYTVPEKIPSLINPEININLFSNLTSNTSNYDKYLRALRTKPFMLLAGISGTGKSRIVRELAFKSCPSELQDADGTTPGNYLMVEVKPNWHDSSELLGYYSSIGKEYKFTEFVKFLVKAMMHPEVPFFVCMDEMNLAPVEQYFAEFLSVLETRKMVGNHIESGSLVKADNFRNFGLTGCRNNGEVYMKLWQTTSEGVDEDAAASTSLIEKGLTLPDNVFIIGTVNMDDTTHQFSRKVIDRAMTIEMNGGELDKMFGRSLDLAYVDKPWTMVGELKNRYVQADDVLAKYPDKAESIKEKSVTILSAINEPFEKTAFEVSYRVLNELVVYLGVLLDDQPDVDLDTLVATAADCILLQKILPRVEGDEDTFTLTEENHAKISDAKITNKLNWLESECERLHLSASLRKLKEMNGRLQGGFTRFWP